MIGTRMLATGASLALLISAVGTSAVVAEDMAATSEAVAIPAESHDIPGTFVLPAGAEGAVPAVLMLHGYGSSADEVGGMYARLADALAAQGVGSLRIDFAGQGVSEASPLEFTWESMTADAATALDWLAEQDAVDPSRMGVQGFSQGAMVGAHLVGIDDRPAAFGSWSGAIYDGAVQAEWLAPSLEACEASGEGQIELDLGWRTILHSCDYFTSVLASTALGDFADFAGPLLLVAGSVDESVPPAVSENAATASASEDVTLELIEGGDHIYQVLTEDQSMADSVIGMTADWYAGKL